jgi:hypothetical protein
MLHHFVSGRYYPLCIEVSSSCIEVFWRIILGISHVSLANGLSIGSYVTAVAWDQEQETEWSTKQILFGTTNMGGTSEISCCCLIPPLKTKKIN